MGRAAVRSAVQAFFEAANLPYVGTVFPSRAYIHGEDYEFNAANYYVGSANGTSAVLVVNIPRRKRKRIAMTGRGGVNDTDIFPITLEIFLANVAGSPTDAQADYDTIADEIVLLIRGNPLLGNSTSVWSAGEFNAGVEDEQSAPFTDAEGTTVFIVGTVRFEVWEWDAGPAGTV